MKLDFGSLMESNPLASCWASLGPLWSQNPCPSTQGRIFPYGSVGPLPPGEVTSPIIPRFTFYQQGRWIIVSKSQKNPQEMLRDFYTERRMLRLPVKEQGLLVPTLVNGFMCKAELQVHTQWTFSYISFVSSLVHFSFPVSLTSQCTFWLGGLCYGIIQSHTDAHKRLIMPCCLPFALGGPLPQCKF